MSNDAASQSHQHTCSHPKQRSGAIALSIAMVLSTFIAAGTWKDVRKRPEKNNIRITGSARTRIASDLI